MKWVEILLQYNDMQREGKPVKMGEQFEVDDKRALELVNHKVARIIEPPAGHPTQEAKNEPQVPLDPPQLSEEGYKEAAENIEPNKPSKTEESSDLSVGEGEGIQNPDQTVETPLSEPIANGDQPEAENTPEEASSGPEQPENTENFQGDTPENVESGEEIVEVPQVEEVRKPKSKRGYKNAKKSSKK
jgi:hypothetical protein